MNFEHSFFDQVIITKHINSTFLEAEKLIKQNEHLGNFVIVAETQSSGKGRNKNKWSSPKGGLWFTMGLKSLPMNSNLTIFTGLILRRSLAQIYPELNANIKIKWPNDIFLNDKKAVGILASYLSYHQYHLIGIGIDSNITSFDADLSDIATSFLIESGRDVSNEIIFANFVDNFADSLPDYLENGLNNFLDEYHHFSYLRNKKVTVASEFTEISGTVKGINKKGALLIVMNDGMIQPLYSGTISKIGE